MLELSELEQNIQNLSSLIGNTPLLEIVFKYQGKKQIIYAKAENLNMTGSIKDRMAYHIILQGYRHGFLSPGDTIIEASSGNTGISFCAIGKALGHPVVIFMPDWMSAERVNLIKSFGAEIHPISQDEGGFLRAIKKAEKLAGKIGNAFLPQQFSNIDNVNAHYHTTGPEIWWQLQFRSLIPDAFVAGVGTGGTIMGIGKFLKEKNPRIKVYPLEPSNSSTLSTGCKLGKHRIQGISDDFIPPILNLDELDSVISVDDGDAIIMAQKLAQELGIGVGISSGANFLGALKVQNELGIDSIVVTVFSDDNKKYLSTDLLREEPIKTEFLSTDVKLVHFRAFNRVCYTCCNTVECTEQKTIDLAKTNPFPYCPRKC